MHKVTNHKLPFSKFRELSHLILDAKSVEYQCCLRFEIFERAIKGITVESYRN